MITKSKTQVTNHNSYEAGQISKPKIQISRVGVWDLFGSWCLFFGISPVRIYV